MIDEPSLQPLEITIKRDHAFKKRPIKPGNTKPSPGCAKCGLAKVNVCHIGAPPSMNNHSIDRQAFAVVKGAWQHAIGMALVESGLPRGLESILVEVRIGFETYVERDEGNLRWMVEKALGDTFVGGYGYKDPKTKEWVQVIPGGWLSADSFWPRKRYSMGNIEGVHTPRESSITFTLFPSMTPPTPAPRMG